MVLAAMVLWRQLLGSRLPSLQVQQCILAASVQKCFYSAQPALAQLPYVEPTENPLQPAKSRRILPWVTALTNPQLSSKTAFRDHNRSFTYNDIASAAYAHHLKLEEDFRVDKTIKSTAKTLHKKRIAIFTPHDATFVIALWSTWLSGGIAVPLGLTHPDAQLEYFLKNSDTSVILCSKETQDRASVVAKACGAEILPIWQATSRNIGKRDPTESICRNTRMYFALAPPAEDSALLLYTSGTTGQPKGVLWRHDALAGQAEAMVSSWDWSPNDTLLHVLPLYHFHGLVNCLITPLSCGAGVWMDDTFKAEFTWSQILSEDSERINVFMAVPTIYVKLLQYHRQNKSRMPSEDRIKKICQQKMRLMVSGSAPLPDSVFGAWENLTGHKILERYGMTETGMILSNPLHGRRVPGTVGTPLPEVRVRIVPAEEAKAKAVEETPKKKSFLGLKSKKENGTSKNPEVATLSDTSAAEVSIGELQVQGPNMFRRYWNNEKATQETFTDDGWFKTGDTAEMKNGVYRLLGRSSTEIIKSGGFKLSALDIENRISEHEDIAECAVYGVPDAVWGEKVVCMVKVESSSTRAFSDEELQKILASWVSETMPAYAAPKEVKIVDEIPRNAMGKINKKELVKNYLSANADVLPSA